MVLKIGKDEKKFVKMNRGKKIYLIKNMKYTYIQP